MLASCRCRFRHQAGNNHSSSRQRRARPIGQSRQRQVCAYLPWLLLYCVKDSCAKQDCSCSPPRPAVLEAVAATSPEQSWSTASGLSSLAGTSASPFHSSSSQHTDPQADVSASQAFSHSDLQADGQNDTEQLPLPSLSGSDLPSSPIRAHTHVPPGPLPHLQTDLRDDDSFDNDDSMSEESSGTAVMVGHPCSDEEDTAERRWRLAEQRGNDIRRASAPPCPKAVGAAGYLKFIVVSCSLPIPSLHASKLVATDVRFLIRPPLSSGEEDTSHHLVLPAIYTRSCCDAIGCVDSSSRL